MELVLFFVLLYCVAYALAFASAASRPAPPHPAQGAIDALAGRAAAQLAEAERLRDAALSDLLEYELERDMLNYSGRG